MGTLGWLVRKDLWRFFADRKGAAMTVVVPVMIASLLGAIFAQEEGPRNLTVLVVDEDQSPETRALVARIDADTTLVLRELSRAEARALIGRGRAAVAVVLPESVGLSLRPAAMFAGDQRAEVLLLRDPSRGAEASMIEGLLTRLMMEEIGRSFTAPGQMREMFEGLREDLDDELGGADSTVFGGFLNSGLALADSLLAQTEADSADAGEAGPGLRPPVRFRGEAVVAAGPTGGYNSHAHNFSGMLCMFLMFWAQQAALELLKERQTGMLTRLRLAPLAGWQLMLGRGLSAALVAVLISAAVFGCGMALFGIPIRGPKLGFALMIAAHAVFIGGFAMLLGGFARSEAQLGSIGTFLILILSFTGGAWLPSFLLPGWVKQVAVFLPTSWATHGLAAMTWRGLGLAEIALPVAVLCGWGIVCGVLGTRAAGLRAD